MHQSSNSGSTNSATDVAESRTGGAMKELLKSSAVRSTAVAGMVIALCASVGGRTYPWVFAAFAVVWVVVSTLAIINAQRSARNERR